MNGLLKVVGVLFYAVAELFIYVACIMGFVNMPEFKQDQNYFVIGFLLLGLAFSAMGNSLMQIKRKFLVSGVLILVAVISSFLGIFIINIFAPLLEGPKDIIEVYRMFTYYTYGVSLNIILILISIFMIRKK